MFVTIETINNRNTCHSVWIIMSFLLLLLFYTLLKIYSEGQREWKTKNCLELMWYNQFRYVLQILLIYEQYLPIHFFLMNGSQFFKGPESIGQLKHLASEIHPSNYKTLQKPYKVSLIQDFPLFIHLTSLNVDHY